MRSSKQLLKPIETGYTPMERFSLRVQNGVEIYEHEARHTRAIPKPSSTPFANNDSSKGRRPRLVVSNTRKSETPVITRSRSDIAGLSSLLRMVTAIG